MHALIVDDEPLARNELKYLLNQIGSFSQIEEAENIEETLEQLLSHEFDVIFLDINLMEESGLDLAKKINKMKHVPHIIFATAHDTYAVQAFELEATDYILKPFEKARIEQAIKKITNSESSQLNETKLVNQDEVLPIEIEDRIYVLNLDDIIAVSVNQGVTTINTVETEYETNEPLSYYEKKLNQSKFIRIHRASIINKKHIQSVEHWFNSTYQVTLTGNIKLQVSRSYMKPFKSEIGLV
ncbi:response regulator transcription factor LytR [Mammaliicoccus vitulinus]|uniref:Response regulator transcription factor LytR n=1 Tax=Mammaliicoccus vitulinus TaxID=71237 RepID=A0ABX7HJM9_9STAP|nr:MULTISPECIES: response regulator transcription factor LytR [Mammaliicoccus]MBM6630201.1 response regulator transcription factor LytR [Mammaliicoccus vitulinus]MEB7657414.1 response regulator transcription factor LytR [Mammaliicoccus vitulinus]PNZ38548.1 DNA-binding response regulator [Mammaliicoccus vitulinus]PTI38458.1 DNA-binding response regulator [Mammaliicoccus vitulinus]QJF26045.1 DNA-binding response regulator [Mammaliicoccus vitulinus]